MKAFLILGVRKSILVEAFAKLFSKFDFLNLTKFAIVEKSLISLPLLLPPATLSSLFGIS